MRLSALSLAGVLALVSLFGLLTPQLAEGAGLDGTEQELVTRINAFRGERGLPTLAVSDTLTAAAKWMSSDMAVRNYFAHTSLDGRSPTQRMADAGYPAFTTWTGEDLAAGFTATADVLNGWINSPAHLAVLMNSRYRAIGVGRSFAAGSTYGSYWTADFGSLVDGPRAAPVARAAPGAAPGSFVALVVALENTGYRGWYRDVDAQQVNIGTNDPADAELPDLAVGWLAANRPATTTTTYVGPGEVGWFAFSLRAPATGGEYVLALRGVVEGVKWLEDDGIFFTIHVRGLAALRSGLSFVR